MADLRDAARTIRIRAHVLRRHDGTRGAVRFGIAGHGLVYLLLGALALALAFGRSSQEADQRGALEELTEATGGRVLLFVVAVALIAYCLWQLLRVVVGNWSERFDATISLGANAFLAVTAVSVLVSGRDKSQKHQQQAWTARVMAHSGGRWLVALVGLIFAIAGIVLLVRGVLRKFATDLDFSQASPAAKRTVLTLGLAGAFARSIVIGLAGVLVIVAAVRFDPSSSGGLDSALLTLRDTAFGPWLLGLVALGLIMFGCYGLAEAKYHKV